MSYRLGIDIGGTFTDAILIDQQTGAIHTSKVPSTPGDPAQGFLAITQRLLHETGLTPTEIEVIIHATTVATNTIIEGKTATTAFVTTEGFRDLLEIARQIRPVLYDLQFEKPKPLTPRHLCFGVSERLDARGQVIIPLDEASVRVVAETLRQAGVEAVAVCLLHAYINPQHEEAVAAILRSVLPHTPISLSSAVAPEFREYYRASTTLINASLQPVVARYLHNIAQRLAQQGILAELLIMQSNGGVLTFADASEKPVFMVESGPAAGVIAATQLGHLLGQPNLISLDMGGTTAKASLTQNGAPQITKEYEVGVTARGGLGAARGAGYPIRTPVIDLVEIGAGGGSIAWVDAGGGLRVGPRSAGAEPGPACYGKGGKEPTVTDANLVLGRLNPQYFLGGEITLDAQRARQAIQEHCAAPLGMDVVAAAHGIIEIANAAMVNALHLVSVQRGFDPREFTLVAFGGAGPLHANRLAAEMEIPTVIVPVSPGVFSAEGLLVTDLQYDYSTTFVQRVKLLDRTALQSIYTRMETAGRVALQRAGVPATAMRFLRQVDMRYVGQSYELPIPLLQQGAQLSEPELAAILARFHQEHDRAYGYSAPSEPTELVNLRLTAIGEITKPATRLWSRPRGDWAGAQKATRPVYFAERTGYVECPIYERNRLWADCNLVGPAIIEQVDATTVIHPSYTARVDNYGNLWIQRQGLTTDN
jgi:N-methylhydantoinase A